TAAPGVSTDTSAGSRPLDCTTRVADAAGIVDGNPDEDSNDGAPASIGGGAIGGTGNASSSSNGTANGGSAGPPRPPPPRRAPRPPGGVPPRSPGAAAAGGRPLPFRPCRGCFEPDS